MSVESLSKVLAGHTPESAEALRAQNAAAIAELRGRSSELELKLVETWNSAREDQKTKIAHITESIMSAQEELWTARRVLEHELEREQTIGALIRLLEQIKE